MIELLILTLSHLVAPPASAAPKPTPTPTRKSPADPKDPRISEMRSTFKPKPRPSYPPRVKGVQGEPKSKEPVVIQPKIARKPGLPSYAGQFVLAPAGPGKLTLKYKPSRPGLSFDPQAPFVIQLNAPEALALTPSLITRENWPKKGDELQLTYKTAAAKGVLVYGEASYSYCEAPKRGCKRAKTPLELKLN